MSEVICGRPLIARLSGVLKVTTSARYLANVKSSLVRFVWKDNVSQRIMCGKAYVNN